MHRIGGLRMANASQVLVNTGEPYEAAQWAGSGPVTSALFPSGLINR
jgi:hypothetical protein